MKKDTELAEDIDFSEGYQLEENGFQINIESPRPLVHIFHQPSNFPDLSNLVRGEASYVVLPEQHQKSLANLETFIDEQVKAYGSFLMIEFSVNPDTKTEVCIWRNENIDDALYLSLKKRLGKLRPIIQDLEIGDATTRLFTTSNFGLEDQNFAHLQITIPQRFVQPDSAQVYPILFRRFATAFSGIMRDVAFDFLRVQTTFTITKPDALGRTKVDAAFWKADKQFYELESSFRFLMLVSANNLTDAWEEFKESGYSKMPLLRYPPLTIDPARVKRDLFSINFEKVHDPALSFILRDKQNELDNQLDLLQERSSPAFKFSSLRLFESLDKNLLNFANQILEELKPKPLKKDPVSAQEFGRRVEQEFDFFRGQDPEFDTNVHIRDGIPGLMVSHGELFIPSTMAINSSRVNALLQHEVGTHVLTYYNGSKQPMNMLRLGLADYDEMQEGLAVLTEYLVKGLNPSRMRLLAARVRIADELIHEQSFEQSFSLLHEHYKFPARQAFFIVARIYQGGGFTKDCIYLRGFTQIWQHLHDGGSLEPLLAGKMALKHIELIESLIHRGILNTPAIRPRYWYDETAKAQLQKFKSMSEPADIIHELNNQ